ncbi:hypothetical protein, partial [Parasphingopyxis lamellibrachiae]|uniref:hypothetical protein n=1 Tax=Parasphingopyxis lamellibrachiae TaxID=680125 RepID=UPI001B8806EC
RQQAGHMTATRIDQNQPTIPLQKRSHPHMTMPPVVIAVALRDDGAVIGDPDDRTALVIRFAGS